MRWGVAIRTWANIAFSVFLLAQAGTSGAQQPIRLCTDQNFYAPLTFTVDGRTAGTHIELTKAAFEMAGRSVQISALPWARCLSAAAVGQYDGVVSAAYRNDRAQDFLYPDGAADAADDAAFLSRSRTVSLALNSTKYTGSGSRFDLPTPVGVPQGYSFASLLRDRGKAVQTATDYDSLFKMLVRGRVRSIVVLEEVASLYMQEPLYRGRLARLPTEDHSTAYYVMFSRQGTIKDETAVSIWQNILAVRADPAHINAINERVQSQLKACSSPQYKC